MTLSNHDVRRSSTSRHAPHGITLLEVLISMGILSVGLISVAALIPAGKSQAGKAVVLDRASIMAANALADAATFGLLRPECLTSSGPVAIDVGTGIPGLSTASLRNRGIYDRAAPAAPASVHRLFLQSRDDLVLTPAVTDDDWPENYVQDGVRTFEGKLTCMYALTPGTPGTLSVIVFHNRDMSASTIAGTMTNGQATLTGPLGDRSVKELLKSGGVIYTPATSAFHQITAAAFDSAGTNAFLTLSTGTAATIGTVAFELLPDSVGLAEKSFWPETSGPFLE